MTTLDAGHEAASVERNTQRNNDRRRQNDRRSEVPRNEAPRNETPRNEVSRSEVPRNEARVDTPGEVRSDIVVDDAPREGGSRNNRNRQRSRGRGRGRGRNESVATEQDASGALTNAHSVSSDDAPPRHDVVESQSDQVRTERPVAPVSLQAAVVPVMAPVVSAPTPAPAPAPAPTTPVSIPKPQGMVETRSDRIAPVPVATPAQNLGREPKPWNADSATVPTTLKQVETKPD